MLRTSVERLHAYLSDGFPFSARITIADNGSTDGTWEVALALAEELPGVRAVRLDQKGRGRAIYTVWSESDARVLAYMDVDLSTDLAAFLPLVAPLISGHSDLAIGSRLTHGARVVRGPKRELISRSYNAILHLVLRTRFSDAQCGFKAIRADRARELLPLVHDRAWFFDTELLVVAERAGLRIHEVPVDWVDDPDSRVDIVSTAVADLRGVMRLVARRHTRLSLCRPGRALPRRRRALDGGLRAALPAPARCAPGAGGERARVAAHRRREHGGEPALHLRDPWNRPHAPPPASGPGGVRARACADRLVARGAARSRTASLPRARAVRCSSSRTSSRRSSASSCFAPGSSGPAAPRHDHDRRRRALRAHRQPGARTAARSSRRSRLGASGARRAPARDGRALSRRPRGQRVCELVLLRGRPGGLAQLEGVLLRLVRLVELHHRRQAARVALGDGHLGAPVRRVELEHPRAAGARRRRGGRAPLRDRSAAVLGTGRAPLGSGLRAHAGGGADVPLQQPGRAADARCSSARPTR